MRLPHAERAYIDPKKISGYLLSATHPVGRNKARFFWSLGFNPDDLKRLSAALLSMGRQGAVTGEIVSAFGIQYIVDGVLNAPNGTSVALRTIWMLQTGTEAPRLVTAFPGPAAKGTDEQAD